MPSSSPNSGLLTDGRMRSPRTLTPYQIMSSKDNKTQKQALRENNR